jgi:hypothetical protein
MKRQLLAATSAVAALALIVTASLFGGAGSTTQQARAASPPSKLFAYVVPTNRGPLPSCSGPDCTAANSVWHFIYVENDNRLSHFIGFNTRATVPNAFVVSSVDERIFVNGAEVTDFAGTFTPPPNPSVLSWSGHWPSTVTCEGEPGAFHTPCDVVGSPAVVPGERTAALYPGWVHGNTEPNGTYVFRFTVHGTLNGAPVDLTASSPPIKMTS